MVASQSIIMILSIELPVMVLRSDLRTLFVGLDLRLEWLLDL